jgi:hypothetical protein
MIAYSSGTLGARRSAADIAAYPILPGEPSLEAAYAPDTVPEYVQSAPKKSMLTGQVLPVFRYYIRARR